VELPYSEICCGSAGVYNVSQTGTSLELLAEKMRHAQSTGAQTVVTANPGCLLQLRAAPPSTVRTRRSSTSSNSSIEACDHEKAKRRNALTLCSVTSLFLYFILSSSPKTAAPFSQRWGLLRKGRAVFRREDRSGKWFKCRAAVVARPSCR
jgi:hypothetical protein